MNQINYINDQIRKYFDDNVKQNLKHKPHDHIHKKPNPN